MPLVASQDLTNFQLETSTSCDSLWLLATFIQGDLSPSQCVADQYNKDSSARIPPLG
jgi:hypothetical protein